MEKVKPQSIQLPKKRVSGTLEENETNVTFTKEQIACARNLEKVINNAKLQLNQTPKPELFNLKIKTKETFGENEESIHSILNNFTIYTQPIKVGSLYHKLSAAYLGGQEFVFTALDNKTKKILSGGAEGRSMITWRDERKKLEAANAALMKEMEKGGKKEYGALKL